MWGVLYITKIPYCIEFKLSNKKITPLHKKWNGVPGTDLLQGISTPELTEYRWHMPPCPTYELQLPHLDQQPFCLLLPHRFACTYSLPYSAARPEPLAVTVLRTSKFWSEKLFLCKSNFSIQNVLASKNRRMRRSKNAECNYSMHHWPPLGVQKRGVQKMHKKVGIVGELIWS